MRSVKLLDCTLRDGGFVNDWNFGIGSIKNIICRLDKAGVDIVEVGFLDQRRPYDVNRSILPDTDSVKPIFDNISVDNAMIVGMIDYGTCDLSRISPRTDSVLNGIRVIFKKKDSDSAIEYCREIKKKGYNIFIQPVSVTSYTEEEMVELIGKVNEVEPYGVSIVDTYGLLHKQELFNYFNVINKNLKKGISIGFHSHNNYQLAYANSIELVSLPSERDIVIDGSLYGMGKGAGNANTELLALYLNKKFGKNYDMDQLLEAVDVDIVKEYKKKSWGYSLLYYIAASNDCHPDYVKYLIDKKTLSVKSINSLLMQIPVSEKLTFDKKRIESLYVAFFTETIDDADDYRRLKESLSGRLVLVLAPGKNISVHLGEIGEYIEKNKPVVIAVNYVNERISADYVFMGNAKRYSQYFDKLYKDGLGPKIICTSNISESSMKIDFKFNFATLMMENDLVKDNPVLMLIKILAAIGVKTVDIAGFDGYSQESSDNYVGEYIQFLYCDDNVLLRNNVIREIVSELQKKIKINFITPSAYI